MRGVIVVMSELIISRGTIIHIRDQLETCKKATVNMSVKLKKYHIPGTFLPKEKFVDCTAVEWLLVCYLPSTNK